VLPGDDLFGFENTFCLLAQGLLSLLSEILLPAFKHGVIQHLLTFAKLFDVTLSPIELEDVAFDEHFEVSNVPRVFLYIRLVH
jgi:hypothetical protein